MAVKGAKALEVWSRRVTDGYPGVRISNMSSSWRDGLAFCAVLHRFRPDLIDFESLDPKDVERNCSLVFRLAEKELDIPALLDPKDMAECESPDRLSILTYLSEFYHKFKDEKVAESGLISQVDSAASSGSTACQETNEILLEIARLEREKEEEAVRKTAKQAGNKGEANINAVDSQLTAGGQGKRRPACNLKRKDSCDSGVSVSPTSSLCNSPPLRGAGGGGGSTSTTSIAKGKSSSGVKVKASDSKAMATSEAAPGVKLNNVSHIRSKFLGGARINSSPKPFNLHQREKQVEDTVGVASPKGSDVVDCPKSSLSSAKWQPKLASSPAQACGGGAAFLKQQLTHSKRATSASDENPQGSPKTSEGIVLEEALRQHLSLSPAKCHQSSPESQLKMDSVPFLSSMTTTDSSSSSLSTLGSSSASSLSSHDSLSATESKTPQETTSESTESANSSLYFTPDTTLTAINDEEFTTPNTSVWDKTGGPTADGKEAKDVKVKMLGGSATKSASIRNFVFAQDVENQSREDDEDSSEKEPPPLPSNNPPPTAEAMNGNQNNSYQPSPFAERIISLDQNETSPNIVDKTPDQNQNVPQLLSPVMPPSASMVASITATLDFEVEDLEANGDSMAVPSANNTIVCYVNNDKKVHSDIVKPSEDPLNADAWSGHDGLELAEEEAFDMDVQLFPCPLSRSGSCRGGKVSRISLNGFKSDLCKSVINVETSTAEQQDAGQLCVVDGRTGCGTGAKDDLLTPLPTARSFSGVSNIAINPSAKSLNFTGNGITKISIVQDESCPQMSTTASIRSAVDRAVSTTTISLGNDGESVISSHQ